MRRLLLCLCAVVPLALFGSENSTDELRRIAVHVLPYYQSEGPVVNVGRFSKGLASRDEQEFLRTIQAMQKSWDRLTFPELYVAAIRLYDLGYRTESVYWFYTAQFRARQFAGLVDEKKMGGMGSAAFELVQAQDAFFQLVGRYLNAYAFGDLDALKATLQRVQREHQAVGNLTALYPGVAFKDRKEWVSLNTLNLAGLSGLITMLDQQKDSIRRQREEAGLQAAITALDDKPLPPR